MLGESLTWDEIKKHNTERDAWIVIDGYVHDVTNFVRMHPGGAKILENKFGKDATPSFKNPTIHEHSPSALELLEKMRIGVVFDPSQTSESSKTWTKKDHGINLDNGIVAQMAVLGSKYTQTLHQIGIANKLELRLFDNPFLESLTVCPWWAVPAVWLPVVFWCFYKSLQYGLPYPFLLIPLLFITGGLNWGFIEYTFHRFLFHMEPKSYFLNGLHFMMHGQHHVNPMNPNRLVFPPSGSAPIIFILYLVLPMILPYYLACAHFAGGLLGYVLYDLTHYYLHHGNPTFGPFKQLKKHHIIHHFKDPNNNFAISFFALPYDWLFGTWLVEDNVKQKVGITK